MWTKTMPSDGFPYWENDDLKIKLTIYSPSRKEFSVYVSFGPNILSTVSNTYGSLDDAETAMRQIVGVINECLQMKG